MKSRAAIFFGLAMFALGTPLGAQTDEEVEAHKLVLDLTGAFSNEGFKLREVNLKFLEGASPAEPPAAGDVQP